jgi:hypothetical protein
MPRELMINSVRGHMPIRYRYHRFARPIMVVLSILMVLYILYFLFTRVDANTPTIGKLLPIVILYISIDSFMRQVTGLNQVIFTEECLWLRFVLRPSIPIQWDKIETLQLRKQFTYHLIIGYKDLKGRKRIFKTNASFPKIMEIIYNISDLAPNAVLNEDLRKMVDVMRNIVIYRGQGNPNV